MNETKLDCVKRDTCRVSQLPLIDVLDLGEIYLNDFLAGGEAPPKKYPLTLAYEPTSGLVQLRHTVDPELMFRTYWYNSGTNESMANHLGQIVSGILSRVSLRAGDVVVDIGCNDGTLLENYPNMGLNTIGFDPAKNLKSECDMFINDFFSAREYGATRLSPAKVVTSIAMMYDLEDPVAFASDVNRILDDDGLWVMEMHYLPRMLERNEVDAICHEHLTYFSLTSLCYVLKQAGFTVTDVDLNDINGGSMLVYARKSHKAPSGPMMKVQDLLAKEANKDLYSELRGFARRVKENRDKMRLLLEQISFEGKIAFGYGASTKGNTLLQYCEITPELLPYIAERNPKKWGRRTVGSNIPIISEEEARAKNPDYFLVLPYHFLKSFMEREEAFLQRGGRFISPVAEPHVVNG